MVLQQFYLKDGRLRTTRHGGRDGPLPPDPSISVPENSRGAVRPCPVEGLRGCGTSALPVDRANEEYGQ
jgi:hypothetical protein